MTVDAVVLHSRSAPPVPVAVHAPVRTMAVVAKLRPVTLRAQAQDIGHGDDGAIGEVEAIEGPRLVAGSAGQLAMHEGEAAVKGLEVRRPSWKGTGAKQRVTGGARDAGRNASCVRGARLYAGELGGLMDGNRRQIGRGRRPQLLGLVGTRAAEPSDEINDDR